MDNLKICFAFTVMRPDIEGGAKFSNRSPEADPGGASKYGVSLKHCRDKIGDKDGDGDIDADDVRLLTEDDARRIFGIGYFDPCNAANLPAPLALMVVDFAYHSGPYVACCKLQERLGVKADGKIGPRTLAVANSLSSDLLFSVIKAYGAARQAYMRSLKNYPANKNGWENRVEVLMAEARKLVEG